MFNSRIVEILVQALACMVHEIIDTFLYWPFKIISIKRGRLECRVLNLKSVVEKLVHLLPWFMRALTPLDAGRCK